MDGIWPFTDSTLMQVLGWIFLALDITLRILALIVVPYNRRPPAAMAWLLLIMVQPIIGWLLYLVLGNNRLPKARQAKMEAIHDLIEEVTSEIPDVEDAEIEAPWLPGVLRLTRTLSAMPNVGGNSCTVTDEFDDQIAAMVRGIDEAREFVHVEFYLIVASDRTEPFFAALERARERGVIVRVLVDWLTSVRYPRRAQTLQRLRAMGAEVADMLPVRPWRGQWQRPDLRNHRKLVVVDGRIGYTGSLNLVDPSYLLSVNIRRGLVWRDSWFELRGPVVRELDALFWSDWWAETNELVEQASEESTFEGELECSVVPSGPGFEGENNLRLFTALISNATKRITIVSPYFVPDDSMSYAITSACLRGVEVELFASQIGDQFWTFHAQRSYYEMLLRAGVTITLYEAPTVLHSKFMTFDDDMTIFGSSNIDMRSFGLNFEVSMFVQGTEMVDDLQALAAKYRSHSTQLTLEGWRTRPRLSQAFDNVARLTSALQ